MIVVVLMIDDYHRDCHSIGVVDGYVNVVAMVVIIMIMKMTVAMMPW